MVACFPLASSNDSRGFATPPGKAPVGGTAPTPSLAMIIAAAAGSGGLLFVGECIGAG